MTIPPKAPRGTLFACEKQSRARRALTRFGQHVNSALDELQQRAAGVTDCSMRNGAAVSPAVRSLLLPDKPGRAGPSLRITGIPPVAVTRAPSGSSPFGPRA